MMSSTWDMMFSGPAASLQPEAKKLHDTGARMDYAQGFPSSRDVPKNGWPFHFRRLKSSQVLAPMIESSASTIAAASIALFSTL